VSCKVSNKAHIFLGIFLEEHDLTELFGDDYQINLTWMGP
jgi:hypothetical protein